MLAISVQNRYGAVAHLSDQLPNGIFSYFRWVSSSVQAIQRMGLVCYIQVIDVVENLFAFVWFFNSSSSSGYRNRFSLSSSPIATSSACSQVMPKLVSCNTAKPRRGFPKYRRRWGKEFFSCTNVCMNRDERPLVWKQVELRCRIRDILVRQLDIYMLKAYIASAWTFSALRFRVGVSLSEVFLPAVHVWVLCRRY